MGPAPRWPGPRTGTDLARVWVALAVTATVVAALCWVTAQHADRASADDAPAALASRTAQLLSAGAPAATVVAGIPVDLAREGSPVTVVFDASLSPVASSASLDGRIPDVPVGVLRAAVSAGENRVSWQPRPGIREAAVALPWQSATGTGVVVAAASLAPSEARTSRTLDLIVVLLLGWFAASAGALALLRWRLASPPR